MRWGERERERETVMGRDALHGHHSWRRDLGRPRGEESQGLNRGSVDRWAFMGLSRTGFMKVSGPERRGPDI